MAEALMYMDMQSFQHVCNDLDFTPFNIPPEFILLLLTVRPNSMTENNGFDHLVDAKALRYLVAAKRHFQITFFLP